MTFSSLSLFDNGVRLTLVRSGILITWSKSSNDTNIWRFAEKVGLQL